LAVEYEIVDGIISRTEADDHRHRGAARAGKTARLAATRERAIAAGRRMVVVTPTRAGSGRDRRGVVLRCVAAPSARLPLG
jgi:hypothetical protein